MTLSIETAFLVALLIAILILAGYLEWSFARGKLMKRRTARMASVTARDEAFNASVTSKAILRNMKSQGYDVSGVESLVRRCDIELEMGNFTQARIYAEDAKNALFEIRARGAGHGDPPPAAAGPVEKPKPEVAATPEKRARDSGRQGSERQLPRNYAEASFTMKSVELEISIAPPDEDATGEARRLISEAKKSFAASDFDAALRLAVKASHALSGASIIQSVPGQSDAERSDLPAGESEGASPCASCGAPLQEGDDFCRRCGARKEASCPSCGGPLKAGDAFCGKCGERTAP